MDIGVVWNRLLGSRKWKSMAKKILVGEMTKEEALRELKKSVK